MLPTVRYRAFHDLVRMPMGGGHEIVYAPLQRSTHVLSPERVNLLLACRGLATLEEHAARMPQHRSARAALSEFVRTGLLVSEVELRALLNRHVDEATPPSISTLAIPTRDRAKALLGGLESYLENARRYGRTLDYLVIDDGTTEALRAETRAGLAALSARQSVRLGYVGPQQIQSYTTALAQKAGVPRELVAFALENPERVSHGCGRSRNALLLLTAGQLFVQVDDDTRCELAHFPGAPRDDLEMTSQIDPRELWIHEADASPAPAEERDFCGLHEELLGKRPGACVGDREIDWTHAEGMFFRRLRDTGGRVLSTQLGPAGDSGTGSMLHLLFTTGVSRERLLRSEEVYRRAIATRRGVRAASRRTIAESGFHMTMALGLDNRDLLPPFFPVLRNSDGVFGAALRVCVADAYSGFLPWTIAHEPVAPRTSSIEAMVVDAGEISVGDLVGQLVISSRVEPEADRANALRSLGAVFERWGSLPLIDFEEIARIAALRTRARGLASLEELLRVTQRTPAFWARDVERVAVAVVESAKRAGVAYPFDLVAEMGETAARAALQRVVRRYGELLSAWPEIVRASRALRDEGVTFVEAL